MLTITLLSCLVGLSPVGPMPEGNTLQTGPLIDIPDNARSRGPDDPAITVVGGDRAAEGALQPCVEMGAFGRPIIARSDQVMRSFDKRVNFTSIKYPRWCGPSHHSSCPPSNSPVAPPLPLDMQPIETRFPPAPGR